MADFQQNFMNSLAGGFQFGQQVRGVQDRNKLNQLASLAYQAPADQRQEILGQAAAVDAGQAGALDRQLGNNDERRNTTMINMAKLLTSAPEQARPGLYQQFIPTLSKFGLSELPTEYNAQTAPVIDQAAQSLVQAYSGGTAGSGVQSTYVDNNGQRVAIMRDGSTQILGGNDTGSNQQSLTIDVNGTPTQVTFDRRTGRYTNAALGAPPQQAPQQAPQGGYQQINGQQTYIDPNLPPQVQQQIRQSLASGQEPPAQMAFAGQPLVGRRAEDQAAAVEAAKLATQQQFLPQELGMRTQAAIQQAGGTAQAKGEAEARLDAVQNLPRVMQESTNAINLIDQALNHPGLATAVGASGRIDPRNYVPGTEATDFRVLLDQIKGGTFLQAFQSLKGGGAITEVEGTKAEQAIARLNRDQSEQAFRQSLQDLREVAQSAISRAQSKARAAGGGAQGQAQRTVVRTGMSNGRRVVQYSDGTIDYGN